MSAPSVTPPTLAAHELLCAAAEEFMHSNSTFESSVAVGAAFDDFCQCGSVQAAFAVPLQHKIFSLDAALRWILFLSLAPARAAEEGDAPLSAPFDAAAALALVAAVYDSGVQAAVWDHFEPDESDDESDEDADADAGAEAGADEKSPL